MGEISTDIESFVTNLWMSSLGVDISSGSDNFFNMGGNSLQLVDLVSQVEEGLGKEIDFAELFAAPTLKCLVALSLQASGSLGDLGGAEG